MKILALEPFYGGSHKDFLEGLIHHSRHEYTLYTMPARFWKWRMRGASLYFSQAVSNPGDYDLLFATDLMSLSDLKALWGADCPPAVLYFHENQISYPLPEGEKMDYQFGFTDLTSALAADKIVFNSHFHLRDFQKGLKKFIKKMPDYRPNYALPIIDEKSMVIYPGCHFPLKESPLVGDETPHILWNHRWEFDKRPEAFFQALYEVKQAGFDFRLSVLGENFQARPTIFEEARLILDKEIVNWGFVESKEEYYKILSRTNIIISTSIQENFGISVIEGMYYNNFPLLPNRLSYPEILPKALHKECLYQEGTLAERLIDLLNSKRWKKPLPEVEPLGNHRWEERISEFDNLFEQERRNGR